MPSRLGLRLVLLTFWLGCNRIDYPSGPLPTAPPLPPPSEPRSRALDGRSVLLFLDQQRLIPLYCHDHGRRLFGADCAKLLPSGGNLDVRISSGAVGTIGEIGNSRCTLAGAPLPSYAMMVTDAGLFGATAALWSDTSYPLVSAPPEPPEIQPQTPSQRRGMRAACLQLGQALGGIPAQAEPTATWNVDLDGDGVRERLDEVRCKHATTGADIGQQLLLTAGRHPERTVPIRAATDPSTLMQPIAVADVDSNGVPELVLRTVSPAKLRIELARLESAGLVSLVDVECLPPARR